MFLGRTVDTLAILAVMLAFLGCETVHQTTKKGGEYIGKGTKALGGITEGAAEGYSDKEENPYNR